MSNYLRLSQLIDKHSEFRSILSTLRPGRLSEDKKLMLNSLGPRVERFLGKDTIAIGAWKEFMGSINEGYIYPLVPTSRQVLSATLLAGAAIKKPNLQLRPDLRPELYQARADLLQIDVPIPPLKPGGPIRIFKAQTGTKSVEKARYHRLTSDYDILSRGISPGGKLDLAIRALLTDPNKSLAPLGPMRSLDAAVIENAKANTIMVKPTTKISPTFVEAAREDRAFAPKRIALALNQFRCVRQQEDGETDQIFWGGSFVRCANLQQIYEQIEQALKQDNMANCNLDFQWSFNSFVRPAKGALYDTQTNGPWIQFGPNPAVFQQELYNGFGPWAGVLFCIEDDDAEYDAVAEVIDTVGDYARAVNRASSTVSVAAAAGGVTGPVAVAAGAVSTASNIVKVGADIAGAVVDIVNFFDKDDMIDSVNLSGDGDYAVWDKKHVKSGVDKQTFDLRESPNAAHYQVEVGTSYSDMAEFRRTWGCTVVPTCYPANGEWYNKKGGLFGASGEIEKTVTYNPPVHQLEAHAPEKKESEPGTAYKMKGYPKLSSSGTVGRVKVHWGISAFRSFKFQITMQAFRFDKKL